MDIKSLCAALGIAADKGDLVVRTPIDGAEIGRVAADDTSALDAKIARAAGAFPDWRDVPAPRRGELVRLFGEELRRTSPSSAASSPSSPARSCRKGSARCRR